MIRFGRFVGCRNVNGGNGQQLRESAECNPSASQDSLRRLFVFDFSLHRFVF